MRAPDAKLMLPLARWCRPIASQSRIPMIDSRWRCRLRQNALSGPRRQSQLDARIRPL